jgi:hypothetical protein
MVQVETAWFKRRLSECNPCFSYCIILNHIISDYILSTGTGIMSEVHEAHNLTLTTKPKNHKRENYGIYFLKTVYQEQY